MMPDADARMSQNADDRRLLSRIVERDRRAFETLYRRYHRRVFHFVFRLIRRETSAEEIVGDTMLAIWQGAASFEGGSTVSTWLMGIAYRQTLKLLEKDRKHSVVDSDDELLAQTLDLDPASDPERSAISESYAELLQKGMESLSEGHRAVVELTAMGHSYVEISEVIGCPENTVKTRMFHARQQLKRYLDRAEHGGSRTWPAGNVDAAESAKLY
jgi:RNA polymerase sigma-70 factor (ECF subfamily)